MTDLFKNTVMLSILSLTLLSACATDPEDTQTDIQAPDSLQISINNSAADTTSTSVEISLSAYDESGISSYVISEIPDTPTLGSHQWVSITSAQHFSVTVPFVFSDPSQIGTEQRTVYVWFSDSHGNISSSVSDHINVTSTDDSSPLNASITINNDDVSTTSTSVTLSLSAEDNVGIIAYAVSESEKKPSANSNDWSLISSTQNLSKDITFTLTGENQSGTYARTVYVWFKDDTSNISTRVSDTINLDISDTQAPNNISISINSGAETTDNAVVSIALVAFDDTGINQYLLSNNNETPNMNDARWVQLPTAVSAFSDSASYSLPASAGSKTVYVWFMDEAGNMSVSGSDSILLELDTVSTAASLGLNWIALGDSETNGRANEESAKSQIIAFENIWNQTQSDPQSVLIRAIGGRDLEGTRSAYTSMYNNQLSAASWVHFQESGGQGPSQDTPEKFVVEFEAMIRSIVQNSPNAIISTETAYSFEAENMTNPTRDWTEYNIQMRAKIAELEGEGITVYLAEVDRNIIELVRQKRVELGDLGGQQSVWGDIDDSIKRHYTGLGNFMLALSIFDALGYDIDTLDHSSIVTNEVSTDDKNLCIQIIHSF